jgi:hypothetical protein
VVAEDPVAGSEFCGEPAKREAREAMAGDVGDGGIEELLSGIALRHEIHCTTWYIDHVPCGT